MIRRRGHQHRPAADERGMVTIYVAIMATALIFVTGLVIDGGAKIATYMEASNLAANAARAGAQAADQGELYSTGTVVIDPDEAEQLVDEYLTTAGCPPGCGDTTVEGNTVTVTVTLQQTRKMLPGGSVSIVAASSATALRGVETGG
jgi:Flp pilus assembly protein TadG